MEKNRNENLSIRTNAIFIDDSEQILPLSRFPRESRILIRPSLSGTNGNYHDRLTNNETPYTHVKYRCERTVLLHHTHPTPAPRASSATHPLVLTFCPADSVPTVLHGKRIFHSKPRPIVILSENSPGDKRGARSEQGRRRGGGSSRRKRSLGRFFRSRDGTIVSIPKVPRQMNIIRAGRSAWLACSGSLCTLITTERRVSSRAWTRIEGHNRLTGYAAAALD